MPNRTANSLNIENRKVLHDLVYDEQDYIKINNLPDVLTFGKHFFTLSINDVEGDLFLKEGSSLSIQFKDSAGNDIYFDMSDEYIIDGDVVGFVWLKEDLLRTYDSIQNGIGYLTIVGELSGKSLPNDWIGVQNVKITKPIEINTSLKNTSKLIFQSSSLIQSGTTFTETVETDSDSSVYKRSYLNVSSSHLESISGQLSFIEVSYREQKSKSPDYKVITRYPITGSPYEVTESLSAGLGSISNQSKIPLPRDVRRNKQVEFRLRFLNSVGEYAQDPSKENQDVTITGSISSVEGSPIIVETVDNVVRPGGAFIFGNNENDGIRVDFKDKGEGKVKGERTLEFTPLTPKDDAFKEQKTYVIGEDGGFINDAESNEVSSSLNSSLLGSTSSSISASADSIILGASGSSILNSRLTTMVGGLNQNISHDTANKDTLLASGIYGGSASKISGSFGFKVVNSTIVGGVMNNLLASQSDQSTNVMIGGVQNGIRSGLQNVNIGGFTNQIGENDSQPSNASIIGGSANKVNHSNSVIIGMTNKSSDAQNTVYVQNLNVDGNMTVNAITSSIVSSSIIFSSGSNIFGDASDDTHTFTGTISVSGSGAGHITASGNISASGTITANSVDINGGTIDGITSLTAGGNLDIGSHDFRCRDLTVDGSDLIIGDNNANSFRFHQLANGHIQLAQANDPTIVYLYIADGDVRLRTEDFDNAVFVDNSTQRVGIGTGVPNGKLTVFGNIDTSGSNGHITASGNISASNVIATSVNINGGTIDGITSLTAGGDLDIGSHNFRAATLQSDTLGTAGVVYALSAGILSTDGGFTYNSGTDTLTVENITATGNITASGDIGADRLATDLLFSHTGQDLRVNAFGDLTLQASNGNVKINPGGRFVNFIDGSGLSASENKVSINALRGHITASGHISASGHLIASASNANGNPFLTLLIDTGSGQFYYTGSYGGGSSGGGGGTTTNALTAGDGLHNGGGTFDGSTARTFSVDSASMGGFYSASMNDFTTTGFIKGNHITASGNISASGTSHTLGGLVTIRASADNQDLFKIQDVDNQNNLSFKVDSNQHSDFHIDRNGVDKIRFNSYHPAQIDNDAYESHGGLVLGSDVDRGDKSGFGLYVSAGPDSGSIYTKERVFIGVGGATGSNDMLSVGGNITTTSHITSSGNISASGDLIGEELFTNKFTRLNSTNPFITTTATNNLILGDPEGNANGIHLEIDDSNDHIDLHAAEVRIGEDVPSSGKTLTVGGEISSSGAINTLSHITASGNISASGNIETNLVVAKTSDLIIRQTDNDKDILLQSDNGSGGTTTYVKLDGSVERTVFAKEGRFNDNILLTLGNAGDLEIFHDGTNSKLKNIIGELILEPQSNPGGGYSRVRVSSSIDGGSEVDVELIVEGRTKDISLRGGHITASGDISASGRIISTTGFTGTLLTAAQTNVTSVGALDAGSITSGFGNINIGTSTFTGGSLVLGGDVTDGSDNMFISASQGNLVLQGDAGSTGDTSLIIRNSDVSTATTQTATLDFQMYDGHPAGKIVAGRESAYIGSAGRISNLQFYTSDNAVNTEKLRIFSNGNVQIYSGSLTVDSIVNINTTHITASGNISASGDLQSSKLTIVKDQASSNETLISLTGGAGSEKFSVDEDGDVVAQNITMNGSTLSTGDELSINNSDGVVIFANNDSSIASGDISNMFKFRNNDVGIETAAIVLRATENHHADKSGSMKFNFHAYKSTDNVTDDIFLEDYRYVTIDPNGASGHLNVKGDISASGAINTLSHITASGNISSSGTITGNSIIGTIGTATQNSITSIGTLDDLTVTGNINANGNIVGDDSTDITNIRSIQLDNVQDDATAGDTDISLTATALNIQVGGAANIATTTTSTKFLQHITASKDLVLTGSGNIYGSSSYLTIKNDGTAPSELRLNCQDNSHYIGIRGPEHSGASSYVLKLPNAAPSDNQILKVDGSPSGGEVTLAWESDGGGGGVSFPTTEVVSSSNALFIGSTNAPFVSASQGNLQLSGSGTVGQLQVDHRFFDTGSSTVGSAGGAIGDTIKFGDSSGLTAGKVYYLESDGTWDAVDADEGGKTSGSLAVATSAAATNGMVLRGVVKLSHDPGGAIGAPLFISTTAGQLSNVAPGSGDFARIVGYNLDDSGLIFFNPGDTTIKVA